MRLELFWVLITRITEFFTPAIPLDSVGRWFHKWAIVTGYRPQFFSPEPQLTPSG
jgi:hypothetical protein